MSHISDILRSNGFGPATIEIAGFDPLVFSTGGSTVKADPAEFVLAATGRLDPTSIGLDSKVNIYA